MDNQDFNQNQDDFSHDSSNPDFENQNSVAPLGEPINSSPRGSRFKIFISLIVILLIIFGAYWFLLKNIPSSQNSNEPSISNSDLSDLIKDNNKDAPVSSKDFSIFVTNQLFGSKVEIASVSLKSPAWISIEEDNEGEPGNILGALWLPSGTHSGQVVVLLRSTEKNKIYYATLRFDAGSDHKFDYQVDLPLTTSSGEVISTIFRTSL